MKLAERTTLGLGGVAEHVVEPVDRAALLAFLERAEGPFRVLAGGSNLVIDDAPIAETVLILGAGVSEVFVVEDAEFATVTVGAGHSWDAFVARSVAEGWTGLEALSGIPGSVGATPIQNVGAYGREVADCLVAVETWDRENRAYCTFSAEECAFEYRHSRFRKELERFVILAVTFRLARRPDAFVPDYAELRRAVDFAESVPGSLLRETVLRLRRGKGMVVAADDPDSRSAGSFFTNPLVSSALAAEAAACFAARGGDPSTMPQFPTADGRIKLSAAWLIERAGFARGYGGACVHVSRKHTLALVHAGGGTTTELLELAREIRAGVRAAFHVELTPEPVFWNCAL